MLLFLTGMYRVLYAVPRYPHERRLPMAYLGAGTVWKGFATRVYRSQLSLGYSHKPCLTSGCRLPL